MEDLPAGLADNLTVRGAGKLRTLLSYLAKADLSKQEVSTTNRRRLPTDSTFAKEQVGPVKFLAQASLNE